MKARKLQPTGNLLLVFLCLVLPTFLFGQNMSREYNMESDGQAITSQSSYGSQLDLFKDNHLYNHGDNSYVNREIEGIREAIGHSQWWEDLSRDAQNEILQKMEALPAEPSIENLQEMLAISWKGQAIKRTQGSMRSCPTGDVFLASQDEVDAFGSLGCTEVTGDLYIDDSESEQKITDLTPLSNLQTVDGILLVTAPQLATLDGLSNISTVGYLRIIGNDALNSLEGLEGITTFTGPLTGCGCSYLITNNLIAFNPLIEDLSGLNNLTSVNSGFYISTNNSLKNLEGLEKYSYSAASLDVGYHPALTSLKGLSALHTVQSNFVIRLNPALKNLAGLKNLTTVGNELIIDRNASLKNLAGLNGLSSVGHVLILQNATLKNISALSGITSVPSDFVVFDNPSLENIDGLSALTTVGGWLVIQNLPALENIDALSNLTSAYDLTVAFCDLIEDLDGLSSFSYMDGVPGIAFLPALQNLDGLSNLSYVGSDMYLLENPSLTSCCGIYQLLCADPPACTSDAIGGVLYMFNNGAGCTPAEIIAGGPCNAPAEIPGASGSQIGNIQHVQEGFTLYPNPVKTEMTISLKSLGSGSARVEISNGLGETLWQQWIEDVSLQNYVTVNLKSIPSARAGIYFVSVSQGNEVYTKKMILER